MQKLGDNRTLQWSMVEDIFGGKYNQEFNKSLPYLGHSQDEVQQELNSRLMKDMTYNSGKILGAMTQPGHNFAIDIYSQYIGKNLGDSGLVKGSKALEDEVISILGNLLGDGVVQGNIVSGGTEANLIAMLLAKIKSNRKDLFIPEVIVPESAHYSFDKAALLMGLTLRKAPLDGNFKVNLESMKSFINENTIGIVGIAGTTALGLVDPLLEIGKLAKNHNLFFHVDGAFGGLVLPFLKELGHKLPPFGLEIPYINSYTVDPHKFGMGVNPSGAILIKEANLEEHGFCIPYLAGGGFKSFNILGTRPAASAISFWALMKHLGKHGFMEITKTAWSLTEYLAEEIDQFPQLKIAAQPETPVLGIQTTRMSNLSCEQLDAKLRKNGWALGHFAKENLLRAVIMPHIKREHIDNFITTLKTIF